MTAIKDLEKKDSIGKLAIITLILFLSGTAYADVLPLDEKNIANGKVVQDGNIYNIVFYTETYLFDGSIIKRIIVENENEINALENETATLFASIGETNKEFTALNANASEINEKRKNVAAAMELINKENEMVRNNTAQLQEKKGKVDSVLTGNVAMAPLAFRAALIIFILLVILVIAARTTGIFSRGRPHEKTPYEEEE
jgi:hypothetical protein